MENVLVRTSSTVGESNLHLQITPAYRQDIFFNKRIWKLTLEYIKYKLNSMGIILLAADCGINHTHIFLANWKNYTIPQIAQAIKGFSSRMMRKNHKSLFIDKLWGEKFWSEGYFYRTVGVVTKESTRFYIEKSQKKHWHALDYEFYKHDKEQKSLLNFSS